MSNFTIAAYDLSKLGAESTSISCKVKGYWSRDLITVYVRREYMGKDKGTWNTTISYGSGGREPQEVKSDTEAARYFAEALVAMANLADELMTKCDMLEANYQRQIEEYAAAEKARQEAKQAKIDADPVLGSDKAKDLVMQLLTARNAYAKMYKRGEDSPYCVTVTTREKTLFYISGSRISRNELVLKLAESSNRTAMVEN